MHGSPMNKPAAWQLLAALLLGGCDPDSPGLSSCETSPGSPCPTQETCPGPCVPLPPLGWSLPVLLWAGPRFEAPECPADRASVVHYEGHADPNEPPECPSCSCEPPTAACELPSILTVGTQTCGVEDPAPLLYDYSGLVPDPTICVTDNPFPAGLIYSLAIGPLTMKESDCKPVATQPPRSGDAAWRTFARACGSGASPCLNPAALCITTASPAPGFSQCLYQQGEHECPSGYPDRRVFYDEISDARRCSECSCGAPEGGECSAYVTLYQDATCTLLAMARTVTSKSLWACGDFTVGYALRGKTSTAPSYEPGWCDPSGGERVGSVELLGPSTFCCQ